MTYEYLGFGLGTNGGEEQPEMDFATTEDYIAAGMTPPTPSGGDLRPMPAALAERPAEGGEAAPAGEKQTWWSGDIGGMVDSFFDKLGIGQQAQQQAENTARVETAVATATTGAPTSISEVAPEAAAAPRVEVTPTTTVSPWYVQYAPHLVIGGLGLGAVVTLVLVLRRRD